MPHKDSLPLAAQKGRNSKTFVYSCSNSTIIVGTEPVTTLTSPSAARESDPLSPPTTDPTPPTTQHPPPRATATQKTEEPEGNRNAQPAKRQSRAAAHTAAEYIRLRYLRIVLGGGFATLVLPWQDELQNKAPCVGHNLHRLLQLHDLLAHPPLVAGLAAHRH
ncbi:hypothetical protein B0H19DRAFT_1272978 [Mycena capillaripes]|nr:hypothetical protein B0H19DRAFT_1272978 [Mycena capillaripes]